ncbi:MAG: fibronectin type III domain-containing protein [bacterium]|nr:fibronectin type III domain-containing protein [bacterium]
MIPFIRFPIVLLLLVTGFLSSFAATAPSNDKPTQGTENLARWYELNPEQIPGTSPAERTVVTSSIDETDIAVTIGTGTSTQRFPLTEYYWFTRTQAIYTASEVGMSGIITRLRWYPTFARNWLYTGGSNTIRIYLGHTTNATCTSQPYADLSGLTLVYQSTSYPGVTTANAWQEFDVTDFSYNGTDNLQIVTQIDLNGYNTPLSGEEYRYTALANYRFQVWEQDYTAPTGSGALSYYRPNVQIEFSTTSPTPPTLVSPTNNATFVPVTTTVSWATGSFTNNVDVYLSTSQSDVTTMQSGAIVSAANTSTTFDPPSDLLAGSTYYWRVVARNTATGETAPSAVWSFTTASPPLSGTKTIGGTNPNYASFTAAINALTAFGVDSPGVVFQVRPGTYNERITISTITGSSQTRPITFRRESGTVTLSATGTSAGSEAIVKLNGCDWVTFDGINVSDLGTSDNDYCEFGYWVTNAGATNGAQNNTITNATISMHRVNNSSRGVVQTITTNPTSAAGANSYNKFLNLKIENSLFGIYTTGHSSYRDINMEIGSTTPGVNDTSRMVVGNGGSDDIGGSGSTYGIFLSNVEALWLHDVDVRNVFSNSSHVYGISIQNAYGTNVVSGNRVHNIHNTSGDISSTGTLYGISCNSASSSEIRCFNNTVSGFYHPRTIESTSRFIYGIYASGNIVSIDNNTVILSPTTVGSSNICVYLGSTTATLRNNLIVNNTGAQTTAKHYLFYVGATNITINTNCYSMANWNGGYTTYYSSSDRQYIDDWRYYSGMDYQSVEGYPWVVNESTGDLRIQTGTYSPGSNLGTPLGWITTDIEGNARNAVTPDIGADEGVFASTTPVNGIKTIGGTLPDYPTFTAAVQALMKFGVGAGGVTFNVRPGTYVERLSIPPIPEATDRTQITFRRESGAVTLTEVGSAASNDAVLRFAGCDWVTFDGINIVDAGTSATDYNEYGVWMAATSATNGAQRNTFKNATIQMHRANAQSMCINQSQYTTPNSPNGANSYNRYLNLRLTDARYGVFLNGNSSYRDMNTEVGSTSSSIADTNRFRVGIVPDDIGAASGTVTGIYANNQEAMRIHDCDVTNLYQQTNSATINGIHCTNTYGTCDVNGNRVFGLRNTSNDIYATGSIIGIYLNSSTSGTNLLRCFNNTISGFSHPRTIETTSQNLHGIYTTSGASQIEYNSILINPANSGASNTCVFISGGSVTLRNNIFYNRTANQTTAKHYGIYLSSVSSFTSNNNLFYIPNQQNAFVGYYSSDQTTLDAWQSYTGYDYSSVQGNPRFISEDGNDLRIIAGVYSPVNNAGTSTAYGPTDIEGDTRSGSTPDIGADEGNFASSAPLTGVKTVGGNAPDYATLTDAVNALALYGVGAGGVTFSVRPGTYSERLVIYPIDGASAANPVLFQKESGAVVVTSLGTSSTTDAMIKLNGCDWVTFSGIDVLDAGTSSSDYVDDGYWITNFAGNNGATNNTIRNATISLNRLNNCYGVIQTNSLTPTSTLGSNSSNHYLNLKFTNMKIPVYLSGYTSFRDLNCEVGSTTSTVTDTNRFRIGLLADDIGSTSGSVYGMYFYGQENLSVHDCDIGNMYQQSSSSALYGIYTNQMFGTTDIRGNRIYQLRNTSNDANATSSIFGMYLNNSTSGTNTIRCYNNTISGLHHPRTNETATTYLFGIYALNGTSYVDYNSILLNPTTIGASNANVYVNNASVYLRNNILYNRTNAQTTAKHYGIYVASVSSFVSNNNLFHISNPSNGFVGYYSSDLATLDAWQSYVGSDYASVIGDPRFLNENGNDLRIMADVYTPVNNAGTSIAHVTTDIEGDARNGSTPDIGADEGNFVSGNPLTGTKTVGGLSPDYITIADAVNALALYGVGTGGVTFSVRPGTYTERLTILPVDGASASNPVVFQKESDAVVISAVGTNASNDAAVKFFGCDWVTFSGISVSDAGTSGANYLEYGYWTTNLTGTNGASNNTIRNAIISLNRTNTSYAIYQSNSVTPTSVNGANNNNRFLNLKIQNARYGVYSTANASYRDVGNEFGSTSTSITDANRFVIGTGGGDDIGFTGTGYGIYLNNHQTFRIHDCDISNIFTNSSSSTVYGIIVSNSYGVCEVAGNRVYNLRNSSSDPASTGPIHGIYLIPTTGSHEVRCFNNTVSGFSHPRTTESATLYISGIYLANGNGYIDHNSVLIDLSNVGATSACFYNSGSAIIRNNIFYNRTGIQSTARHYGLYFNTGSITSNNNLFYLPIASGGHVGYYNGDRTSLDAWQSYTGSDNASIVGNPRFTSEVANDLRIQPGVYSPVNNAGTFVSWVTSDIDGLLRNTSTPDIGADEGNFVSTSPLTGNKTIGGVAADFATFTDAVNALQLYGVGAGGVTFFVRPGVYNERIIIPPVTGVSATSTVTFKRESAATTIASTGTSVSNDALVKLHGSDWIVFDGIDLTDAGTSGADYCEYGFWVTNYSGTNGGTNNTIKNATITMHRDNTLSRAVYQSNSDAPTQVNGANSYNRYLNLRITNTRYGIMLTGHGTYRDIGCEIGSTSPIASDTNRMAIGLGTSDDIGGPSSGFGVYVTNADGVRIHDIDVSRVFASNPGQSVYGIYTYNTFGISEISGCRVTHLRNSAVDASSSITVAGIYTYNSGVAGIETRVFNNFISNLSHPRTTELATVYLYGLANAGGTVYFDNNSIVMNPTTGGATNANIYLTGSNAVLRNNILVNRTPNQSTSRHYGIYYTSGIGIISNNNCFNITNTSGYTGYYSSTAYATIGNWRSATSLDANSVTGDPKMVNDTTGNLHIQFGIDTPISNAGTIVDWINTDLDNETRLATPDIGADEGAFGFVVSSPSPVSGASNIPTNVTLSWTAPVGSTGYDVYLATSNPPTALLSSNQAGTSFTPPALIRNSVYYWRVNARVDTTVGTGPVWSFTTGNGSVPNAPANGAITNVSSNSFTFTWADSSNDETGFVVYRSTDGSTFTLLQSLPPNTVQLPVTGLLPNSRYWYRVFAANATGNSITAAEANAWTLANTPQPPVIGSSGALFLQVTPLNAGTANPTITEYSIYEIRTMQWVQSNGTLAATPFWRTLNDWHTVTVTGLSATASYSFTTRARNGAGIETGSSLAADGSTTAIVEDFSTATFPPYGWSLVNSEADLTWGRYTGSNGNNGTATLNFANYFPASEQTDILWSPPFNTIDAGDAKIEFDWWYESGFAANDGLEVILSTDNGTTWSSLWLRRAVSTTPSLRTGTGGGLNQPAASGWSRAIVSIPNNALGLANLKLGLRTFNQYGPALFIDNLTIYTTAMPRYTFTTSGQDFGNVDVNSTASATVYLLNRSQSAATVETATNVVAKFVRNFSVPFVLPANDSIPLTIQFQPDTTLLWRDTLRLTLTDNTPVLLPLSGTGVGSYVTLSHSSHAFTTAIEPTRVDSFMVKIVVRGNRALDNAYFATFSGPFSGGVVPTIPAGDSASVAVYFQPTTQGNFSGSIGLLSNAINEDTLRITLSGNARYVPAAPGGLSITLMGENARLNWAPVDTSINGVPITVTRYLLFFRNVGTGPWYYLTYTNGPSTTTYDHVGVRTHSPAMYYQITSWVSDTDSLDDVLPPPGTTITQEELYQRLSRAHEKRHSSSK